MDALVSLAVSLEDEVAGKTKQLNKTKKKNTKLSGEVAQMEQQLEKLKELMKKAFDG